MSYIYTVKPLKEAIKIAAADDQFEINDAGKINIYGIDGDMWPAGEKFRTNIRQIKNDHIILEESGYIVPLVCCTETVEGPEVAEVPEFIKNLYTAIKSDCAGVDCRKCPLSLTSPIDCDQLADWLEKRYPEL